MIPYFSRGVKFNVFNKESRHQGPVCATLYAYVEYVLCPDILSVAQSLGSAGLHRHPGNHLEGIQGTPFNLLLYANYVSGIKTLMNWTPTEAFIRDISRHEDTLHVQPQGETPTVSRHPKQFSVSGVSWTSHWTTGILTGHPHRRARGCRGHNDVSSTCATITAGYFDNLMMGTANTLLVHTHSTPAPSLITRYYIKTRPVNRTWTPIKTSSVFFRTPL